MGIVAKQSFYNTVISYAGIGLGFITTILLYPHILQPEQYGLTRVLISASMIGSQFAHLGFRNLIFRFHPLFKKMDSKNHGLFFWTLAVPLAGFLIFALVYWAFRDFISGYYAGQSPLFIEYYFWVIPITFFMLYFEVLNSYLRSLRDSVTGSFATDILFRIYTILILILFFFDLILFQTFIILFSGGYGIQVVIVFIAIQRKGEVKLRPNIKLLRSKLVRGMTSYSLYTLLGGLTTVVVWNIDILMLSSLTDLEQTAIYAIAFYVGSVISVPARAIEKITTPLIGDFIKEKKWDQIETLYKKTALNQFLAGFFILGLIWINLDILFLLLPEMYESGRYVILFIALGKLITVATGTNGAIIITSKFYKADLYTNIFLVVLTVTTNLLLIPHYGILGAAIATAISLTIYNFIKTIYLQIKINMHPFSGSLVKSLAIAIFVTGITLLPLQLLPGFFRLVPANLIFLIFFLIPCYKLKLSEEAVNLTERIINKIKPS